MAPAADPADAAIGLSRVHFPVTTLGPGRRLGLWFQGCAIRCPGCISADTWAAPRQRVEVPTLLARIAPWLAEADGITVSGGEPFDQPQALLGLLKGIRRLRPIDILVYTGYPIERLEETLATADGLIDALISDPFDPGFGQTRALRGSDNQRLHLLTALGRARFAAYERQRQAGDEALDIMFDNDGSVWLAGIPRLADLQRLRERLASQGHHIQTSDHR